ncbi:undecaprenyl-phosphate glucose phosphotransferase [Salinarimonas soli]|uniref:Undecaprenyl-phosphate glucose phosphotransferase n=1 Tax=Salinarimonas soli TaxID=1638099 RepID=A0A5B2V7K8_9HYPH|nr:undecaprenyl-phosphate glucose phosphotransferase [Salinarimonas soli]KAA2234768.1 undecaprenyl-phosphate glucose phosphotransferase [Salinarimonas soli]
MTHRRKSIAAGLPEISPARSVRWPFTLRQTGYLLAASDVAAILLSSLATGIGYHLLLLGHVGNVEHYLAFAAAQAGLLVPLIALRQGYGMDGLVPQRRQLGSLALSWAGTILFLLGIGFTLKISGAFSRGAVLSFAVVGLSLATLQRHVLTRLIKNAVARGQIRGPKVVLVCAGNVSAQAAGLRRHGYTLAGTVTLDYGMSVGEWAEGIMAALRGSDADEVLLDLPWSHWPMTKLLLAELRATPVPVNLLPDATAAEILRRPRQETGLGPTFELQRAPLSAGERAAKRALDVAVAGVALIAMAPLLAVVALAIRLDSPGPFLFLQNRNGFNGRPFRIFKFRSMRVMEDGGSVQQAQRGDPRVTRVGRWLRSLSIDELPQLLNVLRGDMSLIGPRPHAMAHDDQYTRLIGTYAFRHHVKPGITGWAQVNGFRGETPTVDLMERRIELDLWYIANWSFWLDLQILVRTALCLIKVRNVY